MDCEVRTHDSWPQKVVEDDRVNEASVLFLAISAIKVTLVDKASSTPSRCCGGPELEILASMFAQRQVGTRERELERSNQCLG
jgi:hypothetical protein